MRVIHTRSGGSFNIDMPRADDINEFDIAFALAALPRHGGRTNEFMSIAEYAVALSHMMPPGKELWGLLIEAPKAYLPYLPSPIEGLPDFNWQSDFSRVLTVICQHFNLDPGGVPKELGTTRNILRVAEQEQLGVPAVDDGDAVEEWGGTFYKLPPEQAVFLYLSRFLELMPGNIAVTEFLNLRHSYSGALKASGGSAVATFCVEDAPEQPGIDQPEPASVPASEDPVMAVNLPTSDAPLPEETADPAPPPALGETENAPKLPEETPGFLALLAQPMDDGSQYIIATADNEGTLAPEEHAEEPALDPIPVVVPAAADLIEAAPSSEPEEAAAAIERPATPPMPRKRPVTPAAPVVERRRLS